MIHLRMIHPPTIHPLMILPPTILPPMILKLKYHLPTFKMTQNRNHVRVEVALETHT